MYSSESSLGLSRPSPPSGFTQKIPKARGVAARLPSASALILLRLSDNTFMYTDNPVPIFVRIYKTSFFFIRTINHPFVLDQRRENAKSLCKIKITQAKKTICSPLYSTRTIPTAPNSMLYRYLHSIRVVYNYRRITRSIVLI